MKNLEEPFEDLKGEKVNETTKRNFDVILSGPFTFANGSKEFYLNGDNLVDKDGNPLPEEYFEPIKKAENLDFKTFDEVKKAILSDIKNSTVAAFEIIRRVMISKPQLIEELKKDKYKGETLQTLLYNRTIGDLADESDPKTIILLQALAAIKPEESKIKKANALTLPLDPLTANIYKPVLMGEEQQQISFRIPTTPHKADAPETHINAILYFDDDISKKYSLSKNLTAFDKLTASAVYSIWKENHNAAGQCITTLTSIHNCVNKTKPNSAQLEKLQNSLLKQSLTRLSVDNKEEAEALDYEHYKIGNAAILEMRLLQDVITRNGKTTDAGILILAEPPAFAFAEKHGHQLTDIPVEVFQSGIGLTDKNLAIQDYLIRRISPNKNKVRKLLTEQEKKYTLDRQKKINAGRNVTIKVDTLLQNVGRDKTAAVDRKRAVDTAMKYLKHFTTCKWIKGAKLSKDRKTISIELP